MDMRPPGKIVQMQLLFQREARNLWRNYIAVGARLVFTFVGSILLPVELGIISRRYSYEHKYRYQMRATTSKRRAPVTDLDLKETSKILAENQTFFRLGNVCADYLAQFRSQRT